jgi:DNA polymerase-1
MLLQIHDELVFDVIKEEEKEVIDIVTKTMQNIVKLSVPLKVSADTGSDLYETK